MKPVKRFLARLGTAMFLAGLLGLPACDDAGRIDESDAAPPGPMFQDGDTRDAAPAADGGDLPVFDGGLADLGEPRAPDGCSDSLDNNGDGFVDCRDSECAAEPVCCVGSLDAACCAGGEETVEVAFETCDDGAVSSCTLDAAVASFGATEPVIELRTLVPQGLPAYSGLTLGGALDLRGTRLDVRATVRVPRDRCSDCIDATGLALVAPADFTGALNYLRLAILVVGASNETILVLNGEVVDRQPLPLPTGEIAPDQTLVFRSRADGSLEYALGGDEMRVLPGISLPPALVPTVLGQNENRAGEGAISVVSASRTATRCDVPDALEPRSTPVFPATISDFEPALALGGSSVAAQPDGPTWAVVEVNGSLHALQANGVGEFIAPGSATDPGPVVVEATTATATAPWLEAQEGGFQLYYVETTPDGNTRLMRNFFTALEQSQGADAVPVLDASDLGAGVRIRAATHLAEPSMLIVELEDDAGTRLERFAFVDDAWRAQGTVVRARTDDLFAFDRDGVGSPALMMQGGLLRLYYTGRRGTRTSIGVLVSEEGIGWRRLGEALGPSLQGFDSFQLGTPSPVEEPDGVALYYLASDGRDRRIGVARAVGTMGE